MGLAISKEGIYMNFFTEQLNLSNEPIQKSPIKLPVLDENGEKIYQGKDKSGRRQYKNHKEDYNNWNDKERVEEWREQWAKCCNRRKKC